MAWALDFDIESVLSGFSTSLMGTAMRIESAFPKHRVKLLYTTPPQRKPLTVEECQSAFESWLQFQGQQILKAPEGSKNTFWDQRTEDRWHGWKAAHGIKDTYHD